MARGQNLLSALVVWEGLVGRKIKQAGLITVDGELPFHSVGAHLTPTKFLGIIIHVLQVVLCTTSVRTAQNKTDNC